MLKRGHYFSGQVRDEKVIAFVKQHPLAIFASTFFSVLFFLISMFVASYFIFTSDNSIVNIVSRDPSTLKLIRLWIVAIAGCLMLGVIGYYIRAWICYYFNVMILTQEHLVDVRQEKYFNRKISEQSLLRVQDVSSKMSGFWQTWFRCGTVYVETAGEAPNFVMPNIPHPYRMSNLIMELHEKLVQEGGYEEDMSEGEGMIKKKSLPKKTAQPTEKIIVDKKPVDDNQSKIDRDKHQEYLTLRDQVFDSDQLEGQEKSKADLKMSDRIIDVKKQAKMTPTEIVEDNYQKENGDENFGEIENNTKTNIVDIGEVNQEASEQPSKNSDDGELKDGDSVKLE